MAELVAASGAVAATPARSTKVALLADLLRRLETTEIEPAVAFLTGDPRQGKVGVGWAALSVASADPAATPSLTVADVDEALGRLHAVAGPGSAGARQALLAELFSRSTAEEADFLRRLLLGDLRQGALAGVMTDAVAKAAGVPLATARRAAMLAGDLPCMAQVALTSGAAGLSGIGLRVLHPVQPMLAATATDVETAMPPGLASIEWKLDGARIQAHRHGDETRLFTRNLNDVTSRLPGVVEVVRSLPAHSLVLDGEVLGVVADDRPGAFQETMSRFSRHDGAGGALGVWFFDCLHVDGEDLIDRPLGDRMEALGRMAAAWRVPSVVTDDPVRAATFLNEALEAGHEGVMVKALESTYEAGRRGKAWRKVKPVITLDLVVLAAEWGHGRRRGWLSNIHLGARGPDASLVMVGKTFKGLTDDLLTWQTARFLELETARSGIVVEVRPELVVEVAVDGVLASPRYAGGVALRFARVRRYRPDKSPGEADTIEAVRALLPGRRSVQS